MLNRAARSADDNLTTSKGSSVQQAPLFLCASILAAACVAVYATAIPGGFVWLDQAEIVEGAYRVQNGDDFRALWTQSLDSYLFRNDGSVTSRGGYWRPLYALSISLDWSVWKDRATWYHLENILWHVATVVSLFVLGTRLLSRTSWGTTAAFWGTLLFAVHPLGVHTVTWISGRKDAQCAVFGVLAIIGYLQLRSCRGGPWCWAAFSSVCLLLALGFKELAFVVPLVITLLEMSGSVDGGNRLHRRRRLAVLAGLWMIAGSWFLIRGMVVGGVGLNVEHPTHTIAGNLATYSRLWWHYLSRVFWPLPPDISDRWRISHTLSPIDVMAMVAIVLAAVVTFRGFRRRKWWLPLWLWYVVWLLPASGFIPLRHLRAERYLYPASWGVLMILTAAIFANTRRPRTRRRVQGLLFVLAVALSTYTAMENLTWHGDKELFSRAVNRDPGYIEGRLALAHWHLQQAEYEQAARQSATAINQAADKNFSGYWSPFIAHTNYGLALYYLSDYAAADREFLRAVQIQPDIATAHYHRGLSALGLNRPSLAEKHLERALELRPDDLLAIGNLAYARLQQGNAQGCADLLSPLVAQDPEELINRRNYATALLLLREFPAAVEHFEAVVARDPNAPIDRAKLAWALAGAGRLREAILQFEKAHKAAPGHPTVRYVQGLLEQARKDARKGRQK